MKARVKSRPFTLIELVVCIALLAMIGTLFGLRGNDLMKHYGFSASVSKVGSKCRLARVLATNYRADVRCHFTFEGKKVVFSLETDEPKLKRLPQFKKSFELEHIDSIEVDGVVAGDVELLFSGSGGVFPECILTLKSGKKRRDLPIALSPIG